MDSRGLGSGGHGVEDRCGDDLGSDTDRAMRRRPRGWPSPARSKKKRCSATGMLRSSSLKTNQDGIVFHAGVAVGRAVGATVISRRWVAAISAAVSAGTSAQNWWWKRSGLIRRSLPPVLTVRVERLAERAAGELLRQRERGLPLLGCERAHVDERSYGVVLRGRSVITMPPYEWATSTTGLRCRR